jgi:hypothetical protein
MRYLESSSNADFLPRSYILCPLYVANPKISSYNNQGARTKNWLRRIVVKVVRS